MSALFYIPFCNLFAAFVRFDENDLETSPDNEIIETRFRLYIEYHKRILLYVGELNEIVFTALLVEIIIFGI